MCLLVFVSISLAAQSLRRLTECGMLQSHDGSDLHA